MLIKHTAHEMNREQKHSSSFQATNSPAKTLTGHTSTARLHPEIQFTYKLCQMTWTLNNSEVKSYSTFFQLVCKPNTIRMSNMLKMNTSWSDLIRVLLDYQRLLRIHVWVSKQTLHKVNYFWLFKLIYPDPLLQSTFVQFYCEIIRYRYPLSFSPEHERYTGVVAIVTSPAHLWTSEAFLPSPSWF